jgi:ceramidase
MSRKKWYLVILMILTLAILSAVFAFMPRIPQWNSYHQFSDVRKIVGIPNFANVISNIPFLLVSILGFLSLWQKWRNKNLTGKEAIVFLAFFIGVFMTGIGSAYYHWLPNNDSLVWDRLPMTVVFMSLLSLTIMGRINSNLGFWLLAPLILFGVFSVLYWHWTELLGRGDLRLYGIVQFYTIFLLILILCFFPKSYPPLKIYIGMFIFYGLAKLCEHFDLAIYRLGEVMSGHTLKHIFAAISTYGVVLMLKKDENI